MWVYRVEIPPPKRDKDGQLMTPPPRFIDIEFSPDYRLHPTHKQRTATEFRVPHFDGFTMPPSTEDSETAAMFKSLLLRAISVEVNDKPEDVRFADAFKPLCEISGRRIEASQAFAISWLAHKKEENPLAAVAAKRFLDRYEFKSLWETQ